MKIKTIKITALLLSVIIFYSPLISCSQNGLSSDVTESLESYLLLDGNFPTSYDSVNFLRSDKDDISSDPNVRIIKLYPIYFSPSDTAANLAARSHDIGNVQYMLVSAEGEIKLKDSKGYTLSPSSIPTQFFLYALTPDKVFDPSVKIFNTYCITNSAAHTNMNLICFSTQYGEKFLITGSNSDYDTIYLFSATEFHEKLRVITDYYADWYEETGHHIVLGTIYDIVSFFTEEELSEFVFTPRE